MQFQVKGNASVLRYPGDATDADTRIEVELSDTADDEVANLFKNSLLRYFFLLFFLSLQHK